MAEICKVCGMEIPEEELVCPGCGNPREPEPVKKKRVKWWMILVPIVVVIAALAVTVLIMWDAIYIRIAPTAVLGEALGNTITELSTRGTGTPLEVLNGKLGDEGKYTTEMGITMDYGSYMTMDASIVSQNDIANAQYDMSLKANLSMYGFISFDANIGVYVDQEHLAANWAEVFGEDYYGIAFDTMGEDIRGNGLVYDALGEDALTMLEEYFDAYRSQMDMSDLYAEDVTFSREYGQILLSFANEHKPVVAKAPLALNGTEQECYSITYAVTGEELAALVEQFADAIENDEAMVEILDTYSQSLTVYGDEYEDDLLAEVLTAYRELADTIREENCSGSISFYLYDEKVVYLKTSFVSESDEAAVSLMLGENSAENDIILLYTYAEEENSGSLELTLTTKKEDTTVEEQFSIVLKDDYDDLDMTLGYVWNRDTGDFTVTTGGTNDGEDMTFRIDLLLYEEGEGLTLELPDFFALMASLDPEMAGYYDGMHCGFRVSVYPGAEISKPEYINIRELDESKISEMEDNLNYNYGLGY